MEPLGTGGTWTRPSSALPKRLRSSQVASLTGHLSGIEVGQAREGLRMA